MGYNRRFIYSSVAKIEVCAVFHSRAIRKVYKALCGDAMLVPFQGAPRWKSWSWADRTLRTMTIHATWLVQLVRSVEVGFKKLLSFLNLFQYYSDSNDAESWMKEKMYVVSSEDYGRDEQSAMVGEKPKVIMFRKRSLLARGWNGAQIRVVLFHLGGLMGSVLASGSSGPGLSSGWGHCVGVLRQGTFLSQCFSPPRCINGYRAI